MANGPISNTRGQIATIFTRHENGGCCRRLYYVIEQLLNRGFVVHYISAGALRFPEHPNLVPHIVRVPSRKQEGLWFLISFSVIAPFVLLRLTFQHRIAAVVAVSSYFSLLTIPAVVCHRASTVLLLDSVPWPWLPNSRNAVVRKIARGLFRAAVGASAQIGVASEALKENLTAVLPDAKNKVTVLPYASMLPIVSGRTGPMTPDEYQAWLSAFPQRKRFAAQKHGIPEKALLIAATGELILRKNFEAIIRAVAATGNERMHLFICGDGPERTSLLSLAVGLGVSEQVVFAGWTNKIVDILSSCDVLLVPAEILGPSTSASEALGLGIAVLAPDTPGCREILYYDDLLFKPNNVAALADKLEAIADSRSQLEYLKRLSRERATKYVFDWGLRFEENFVR